MKLMGNKWLRCLLLWGVFQCLILLMQVVRLPLLWGVALQGVVIVGLFSWLDGRYLHISPKLYAKDLPFKKQLLALLPLATLMVLIHTENLLSLKSQHLVIALVIGLEAGIMEEYIMRGLLLGSILKEESNRYKDIWLAALLSSLLFALSHLGNLVSQPLKYTLFQALASLLFGLFWAATYLRSQSLIWVIFFHFLQDFSALSHGGLAITQTTDMEWSEIGSLIGILAVIVLPIVGWLLRPSKQGEILLGFKRY